MALVGLLLLFVLATFHGCFLLGTGVEETLLCVMAVQATQYHHESPGAGFCLLTVFPYLRAVIYLYMNFDLALHKAFVC